MAVSYSPILNPTSEIAIKYGEDHYAPHTHYAPGDSTNVPSSAVLLLIGPEYSTFPCIQGSSQYHNLRRQTSRRCPRRCERYLHPQKSESCSTVSDNPTTSVAYVHYTIRQFKSATTSLWHVYDAIFCVSNGSTKVKSVGNTKSFNIFVGFGILLMQFALSLSDRQFLETMHLIRWHSHIYSTRI